MLGTVCSRSWDLKNLLSGLHWKDSDGKWGDGQKAGDLLEVQTGDRVASVFRKGLSRRIGSEIEGWSCLPLCSTHMMQLAGLALCCCCCCTPDGCGLLGSIAGEVRGSSLSSIQGACTYR